MTIQQLKKLTYIPIRYVYGNDKYQIQPNHSSMFKPFKHGYYNVNTVTTKQLMKTHKYDYSFDDIIKRFHKSMTSNIDIADCYDVVNIPKQFINKVPSIAFDQCTFLTKLTPFRSADNRYRLSFLLTDSKEKRAKLKAKAIEAKKCSEKYFLINLKKEIHFLKEATVVPSDELHDAKYLLEYNPKTKSTKALKNTKNSINPYKFTNKEAEQLQQKMFSNHHLKSFVMIPYPAVHLLKKSYLTFLAKEEQDDVKDLAREEAEDGQMTYWEELLNDNHDLIRNRNYRDTVLCLGKLVLKNRK